MTEELIKSETKRLVDKGVTNPSAITAILFQKGCTGRYDKLYAFVGQEMKNYFCELARNKKK